MTANTRTLYLPDGGTVQIPLPGSNGRFEMTPPSALAFAGGDSRLPTLMIGILLGATAGVAVTAWYLNRRR